MESIDIRTTAEERLVAHADAKRIPINGIMELTPLCNMNCEMCYVRLSRAEMERRGRMLSGAEWLALGRQMAQAGTLFLLLTGGEPLLHPDFKEIFLGLKRMGLILTINTNGTLIDEKWAAFFGENKPRRINITLYGADDQAYATLCHNPHGFSQTVQAIRLLRQQGVDVKMNGSITPSNLHDMERIIEIAKELDVPYKLDTYMYPAARERSLPFNQQARLVPEMAAEATVKLSVLGKDRAGLRQLAGTFYEKLQNPPAGCLTGFPCRAGSSSFMINWQGNMRPCIMVDEPSCSVIDLGFDGAWKQIVGASEKIPLSQDCAGCELRGVCQVCAACAKLETGRYDGTPEYMCRFTRARANALKKIAGEEL